MSVTCLGRPWCTSLETKAATCLQVHKQQTEAARSGKASFSWAWLLDERCDKSANQRPAGCIAAHHQATRLATALFAKPCKHAAGY